MDDLPDALNRLATRLEILERRVYALEHPSDVSNALPALEPAQAQGFPTGEEHPFPVAGGAFPVLGRAMLGIAGAYLLRAVTEASSLPKLGIAALAIAYAMLWLVWATRSPAGAWFASMAYACTSALILAPMLWELTLRFKILPASATAGVLGAFVCAASALAWKRNLTSVFWVANMTAVTVALALLITTHEIAPFIAVLLLMVLLCEYAAARNRGPSVRPLVAAAADMAIWALIFIYSSPQSARVDYPLLGTPALLAPGFTLFLIYGASVTLKTTVLQLKITAFETVQTMIAFLLAASSLLYFEPRGGATVLGAFCLVLSAASYTAVFVFFLRAAEPRNERVYANWSAALFLAGALMCLPPLWMALWLSAGAIAATVLGIRLNRPALEFHGMAYLLAAAIASGLFDYVFQAFAGTLSGAPAWSMCVVTACAVLCCVARKPRQAETWKQQLFDLVTASVEIAATAALLVEGLAWLTALRVNPGAHHLAFIRTLTICAAALALAFSGAHWRRMELTRIGYATLVLVAAKLVFEDLRHGHLEFIAASIFLFAITLIAVPRIARMGQRI